MYMTWLDADEMRKDFWIKLVITLTLHQNMVKQFQIRFFSSFSAAEKSTSLMFKYYQYEEETSHNFNISL